ncbi:precorrin-6A reductase [Alkaliphilus oremlandii]|uniref:Precorrin-6x reductase n=1 Tax=Alkaliphilus oremlandii (strain OhILAs) TaxID=350688 RepID=A8MG31_ALKOO|nr:precorrin-6A reductase [Alkaliphilus oremlandii]ABW18569.1 precorrin-6x reductase [Alkaliphilus oremlandii OhILAs]
MIWMIGGTSEFREVMDRIGDVDHLIGTIATDGGKEFVNSNNIVMGRMGYNEMSGFIDRYKISTIIDLSHPYAKIVSANAKKIAKDKNIEYIRYIRKKADLTSKSIYLDSYEDCYEYLSHISGTVFFTTGSKNIGDFEKVRGNNRFIYRVLPALESIEECKRYEVQLKDIVAVLGPFSKEYNKVMFQEYGIDYMVTKDSGKQGGMEEKLEACEELNIMPIIIGREDEEGITDLNEIEQIIRTYGRGL